MCQRGGRTPKTKVGTANELVVSGMVLSCAHFEPGMLTHRYNLALLLQASVQGILDSMNNHAHTLRGQSQQRFEFAQVIGDRLFLGVREFAVSLYL